MKSPNTPQSEIAEKDARFIKKHASTLIAFGEFIDGYDLAVIGVAMVFLSSSFALSPVDKGLLVAISFLGTAVGLIVFGDLSDRIGRKRVFAFNLWIFIVTALLAGAITQVWMLWVLRFLIGVAVGMDLSTSAAYLAEIAPKARRGRVTGSLLNIMMVAGALFAILLAMFLYWAVPQNHHDWIWRGMFVFAAVPAAIVLFLRKRLPESPRWLLQNGQTERAWVIIRALGIEDEMRQAKPRKSNREYRKLFHGEARRRVLVCTAFFMLNSTAGPVVSFLGPVIFQEAGVPASANLTVSLLANLVAFIALFIGAYFIDRVNRRNLGMVTALILTLAAAALGLFGALTNVVLFAAFIVWSFTTYFGPGMLALVWSVEAYPTELRGFGAGLTQSMARVMSAIVSFLVPILVAEYGYYAIAPFAIVYLLMFILVLMNPWLASTAESLEEVSEGSLYQE
ncbi:MFS transporter [Arcanobacterium hippocoleae]|uniref:MFS transporter n=1 Tax=Arcanobacterium hippocoleae TaxID=149017 RepID=A0ABU1T1R9_9ACTO|nr:MFS transporter [Arcanobacterium hippocoleae]MDR6939200.1 putative MFS transporter [Arcanobacterium hippocoleae]